MEEDLVLHDILQSSPTHLSYSVFSVVTCVWDFRWHIIFDWERAIRRVFFERLDDEKDSQQSCYEAPHPEGSHECREVPEDIFLEVAELSTLDRCLVLWVDNHQSYHRSSEWSQSISTENGPRDDPSVVGREVSPHTVERKDVQTSLSTSSQQSVHHSEQVVVRERGTNQLCHIK